MKCIYCGYPESKVVDSRPLDDGISTRRRRECLECGRRFTTYEKAEFLPIMVVKKDGSRESFDIDKIKRGIRKSCEKRNVSAEQIETMALEIERKVYNDYDSEISTEKVGELVMEALKNVDEVAYVRFASVYRQFKDVGTFMDEIKKLMGEK